MRGIKLLDDDKVISMSILHSTGSTRDEREALVDRVLELGHWWKDIGATYVGFGDTTGVANPLQVQRFSRALSQPTHGVFSIKDADGTNTLAVVAWEAVERVLIRGVKQLPGDIAD